LELVLGEVVIECGALTDAVLHWNHQIAECQKKIMMAPNFNVTMTVRSHQLILRSLDLGSFIQDHRLALAIGNWPPQSRKNLSTAAVQRIRGNVLIAHGRALVNPK
jgi:hypothetical protein